MKTTKSFLSQTGWHALQSAVAARAARRKNSVVLDILAGTVLLTGCWNDDGSAATFTQPVLVAKSKAILTVDGYQFKDLIHPADKRYQKKV